MPFIFWAGHSLNANLLLTRSRVIELTTMPVPKSLVRPYSLEARFTVSPTKA